MADEMIQLVNLTKEYDGEQVLNHINLTISRNEFITLLGPSGCGKTTTLRIIGGFEAADEGDVFFEGERINNVPAFKRKINTVFQSYALFPHLNVFENIAFGLKIKKVALSEIKKEVSDVLALVNLTGYEKRSIDSLSGGQQQRVAIARAIVNKPEVLLLDEPLAALDSKLRKEMQVELKKLQKKTGITFIFVTHDQEEALTMSDTVVVMKHGSIQQMGTPLDIYNEPVNRYVADFIGVSTILDGRFVEDYKVEFAGRVFDCVDTGFAKDEPVDIVIRPEDIVFTSPEKGQLVGTVTSVIFKGVHYEMIVDAAGVLWKLHNIKMAPEGSQVGLVIGPEEIHVMKKVTE